MEKISFLETLILQERRFFIMSKTKKMILSALLLALDIVLARFFSVRVVNIAFSFGFVPLILSAIWLGPKYSTLIGGLADLIGALLFPVGQYFVGYTISSLIDGFIYGIFLYKKPGEKRRLCTTHDRCRT